jgi:hypothetical protein
MHATALNMKIGPARGARPTHQTKLPMAAMVVMTMTAATEVEGEARIAIAIVRIVAVTAVSAAMTVPLMPPAPTIRYLLGGSCILGLDAIERSQGCCRRWHGPYAENQRESTHCHTFHHCFVFLGAA